jgi:hypothetical protein
MRETLRDEFYSWQERKDNIRRETDNAKRPAPSSVVKYLQNVRAQTLEVSTARILYEINFKRTGKTRDYKFPVEAGFVYDEVSRNRCRADGKD